MLPTLGPLEGMLSTLLRECSALSREEATPILLTPASTRSEHRERFPNLVRDVEESMDRVRSLQADLSGALQLLASYRTHVVQAASPTSALPPEILSYIFTLCCSSDLPLTLGIAPPNQSIGATCARWRSIVLSIPKLWKVVPIVATSTSDGVLERSHLAGAESLTLRVLGESEDRVRIRIPVEILPKITTIEFTHGDQIDWLEIYHTEHKLETPSLSAISHDDSPDSTNAATCYEFNNNRPTYDYLLSAQTLICQGVLLVHIWSNSYYSDSENEYGDGDGDGYESEAPLPLPRLTTLKLEGRSLSTAWLDDADAPELTTWCTTRLIGAHSLQARSSLTKKLHRLRVHGDATNANLTGFLLHACPKPDLHSLSLRIIPWSQDDEHPDWEQICRLFKFSHKARSVTIASGSDYLWFLLKAMIHSKLQRLTSLTITLIGQSSLDAKWDEHMGKFKAGLGELFSSRATGGQAPLERLRISRALLGAEEEWFSARVGALEISDD